MLVLVALLPWHAWPAGATTCVREEFVAVVEAAAGALRDLNQSRRPGFQEKLRQLKQKRGWTHDQFMKEGAPFVQDERIATYDAKSSEFLERINTMGERGSTAPTPDCALLLELRAHMKALVETQTAKWEYMHGKLDDELKK